jgi:hypothetical protein
MQDHGLGIAQLGYVMRLVCADIQAIKAMPSGKSRTILLKLAHSTRERLRAQDLMKKSEAA